jgi:preprotein translocase subunit SecG
MRQFLTIFQIAVSLLLILTILLQEKGVGLSAAFGGGGEFYRSRRGLDKILFVATVVLALLFIGSSIAFIFVPA